MVPSIDVDVIRHLVRAAVWRHVKTAKVMSRSNQVEGWMSPAGLTQLEWLTDPRAPRMRRGPWWMLHRRVGKKLRDYRADNGVFGPGSLQVVVSGVLVPGLGHAFYADVDSDSPNMDLWHALKHVARVVGDALREAEGGPQEAA